MVSFLFASVITIYINSNSKSKKDIETQLTETSLFAYTTINLMLENDGIKVDDEIYKTLLDSMNIWDIDVLEPVLILRYSRYSCESCVDYVESEIKGFIDENSLKQYVRIVSDYNTKDFDILPNNTVNIGRKRLNIPLDNFDVPYIFIMDNQIIRTVFIPEEKYKKYLDFYLSVIKEYSMIK